MSTNQPITAIHEGISIVYNEARNVWEFTLRGRDRTADSLAKAKEFIDKPSTEKKAPFNKVKAWRVFNNQAPALVTVTGIAETDYAGRACVWIESDGRRKKENIDFCIYSSDESNDALAKSIQEKRAKIEILHEECGDLRSKMTALKIEDEK